MSQFSQADRSEGFVSFLSAHRVFTVGDVQRFMASHGSANANTRKALLAYHQAKGRILMIRRGMYIAVPSGRDPSEYSVDPFLVAAKATDDAVIAYHSALEYHGKAHSAYRRVVYVSERRSQTMQFQGHQYERAPVPHSLRATGNAAVGVSVRNQEGVDIRVTNLERTSVDVLDRPELSGSWEEIWHSLESIEFLDLDRVIDYVELLGNATTVAKVGFYLEQHRDTLIVEDKVLQSLAKLKPKQPHYMSRNSRFECRLMPRWNLLVPAEIVERTWEDLR